jgi:hypothetical protein
MVKAISLRDYYNRLEAFYDADPMIRIAAIHRAGGKIERNARLRQTLRDLLNDRDSLVARYAAITLAQSGDASGLHHLVQAISRAQGQDRKELDACLRNCVRFPFAVLLNERVFVETIPAVKDEGYREVLNKALELTSDDFYEKSERDTSFRDTFLKIMRSLDGLGGLRAGSILDMGWILSTPMGKQPGFLICPGRRLFLKFHEESVLNRGYVERGRQVLFVAPEGGSSEADCLYVFEDMAPRQQQVTPEDMTDFARQSGLIPGVIAAKWESPDRVQVLCANGQSFPERYRVQKSFVGQFVLVEAKTEMGRPQCHFVPVPRLGPATIRRVVSDYAAFNNLVLAQLTTIHDVNHPKTGHPRCIVRTEKGEEVTTFISAPRERSTVLMQACHVCQATAEILCENCEGQGESTCSKCSGFHVISCDRCKGSGTFTCPVCNGSRHANCKVCKGSGRNLHGGPHGFCNGTGKVLCGYCSQSGHKTCGTCHGSRRVPCDMCAKAGKVPCSRCRRTGKIRCPFCQGSRLIFHSKVDCLRP